MFPEHSATRCHINEQHCSPSPSSFCISIATVSPRRAFTRVQYFSTALREKNKTPGYMHYCSRLRTQPSVLFSLTAAVCSEVCFSKLFAEVAEHFSSRTHQCGSGEGKCRWQLSKKGHHLQKCNETVTHFI